MFNITMTSLWHPLLINALTLGTLFWEVSYAALIWPRLTRPLVLAVAVFVHLGIGLTMGMMEFGIAMLIANMAFLPPHLNTFLIHPDSELATGQDS